MWKVSWRGLLAHKARFVLTALAVLLGVMFITATYVLTDTTNVGFQRLFSTVNAGVDLQVRAVDPIGGSTDGPGDSRPAIPAAVLDLARSTEGVAEAEGLVFRPGVSIVGADGEVVQQLGRPVFAVNYVDQLDLTPYSIREGRAPERPDEVLLDSNSVEDGDLTVGGPVDVIFPTDAGRQTFTIAGVLSFGDQEDFSGAQVAMLETSRAQEVFEAVDEFDFVAIAVEPRADIQAVKRTLASSLPPDIEVLTGEQVTNEQVAQLDQFIGIFGWVLRGFGFVGMFVAAFIIVNTFTIVVSQRVRELALLRALGASPRQIVGAVLAESALIGITASAAGIGVGYILGSFIQTLLAKIGFDPGGGIDPVLDIRTVVVGLSIGIGVTMLAAVVPAIRAARTRPLAAVREVEAVTAVLNWTRITSGFVAALAGIAALLWGAQAGTRTGLLAAAGGALVLLLGTVALGPLLARPAAVLLGGPVAAISGINGRLARANVARNPRRTAITASALMIGLAIAMAVMVLTASVIRSIDSLIDESIAADLTISDSGPGGFTTALRNDLRDVAEIGGATAVRYGDRVLVEGKGTEVSAIEPDAVDQLLRLDTEGFAPDVFANGGALVSAELADERGWQVGDVLEGTFPKNALASIPIAGTFRVQGFMNDIVVSIETYEDLYKEQQDFFVLASAAPGVELDALRLAVEQRIGDRYPNVDVKDREELKDQQRQQAMIFLAVFVGLMLLTLFISILGILNTLALSVIERTREIGLLRAVGSHRRQIAFMVEWEAMIVALLGGVLGSGIGVVLGLALTRALQDFQVTELASPWQGVIGLLVVAAVSGLFAALYPAWRASRLDVLRAIATD